MNRRHAIPQGFFEEETGRVDGIKDIDKRSNRQIFIGDVQASWVVGIDKSWSQDHARTIHFHGIVRNGHAAVSDSLNDTVLDKDGPAIDRCTGNGDDLPSCQSHFWRRLPLQVRVRSKGEQDHREDHREDQHFMSQDRHRLPQFQFFSPTVQSLGT